MSSNILSAKDVSRKFGALGIVEKTPSSQDVEGNLRLIRKLYTKYHEVPCRSCKAKVSCPSAKKHIREWIELAQGPQPAQISGVWCRSCKKWTCFGCRGKPTLGKNTTTTPIASINHCCNQGRLFGIWILLARFDEVELQLQAKAAETARKNASRIRRDTGIGYSHDNSRPFFDWNSSPSDPRQQDDLTDKLFTHLVQLLAAFLPDFRLDSSFDRHPPPELFSLFRLSLLVDRVAALIRNDSIADVRQRASLYNAVLDFILLFAAHSTLVPLILEKRPNKKRSPGIQFLGGSADRVAFTFDNSASGMCASLITSGAETLKHAKAFANLATKSNIAQDLREAVDPESMAICRKIIKIYKIVGQIAPEITRKAISPLKDPWMAYTESNRVTFTEAVLTDHSLWKRYSQSTKPEPEPGRMRVLSKEIASMTTSLPPGIFLKISESRPDIMKVLITGAEGSPYAGGLFTFDVFLPWNWPVLPPEVLFTLEVEPSDSFERGRIATHIHMGGGLCLSLLNTWSSNSPAERWQPNKSTLLSVFVSIQAMILGIPDPLDGDEDPEKNKLSQCKTVRSAMLYWLSSTSANSIWKDIADTHFKYRGKEILAQIKLSAKTNQSLRSFGQYSEKVDLVEALEKALDNAERSTSSTGTRSQSRYY
ncbi:hypothetical protein EG329_007451 [Mollisiaceae sp. DMI_Dod_QoI]|nr:hypothetical protein EG329_007451 [Helotiales sp. DMI_Dod_QoI]